MALPVHVIVHPLVLLSTVDHYNRVIPQSDRNRQRGPKKRVVGALLGSQARGGPLHITNSFALPFEEEARSGIWFLDHNYLDSMFKMFKKVNAKERIVGWYSTGPKIRSIDLDIHELFRRYTDSGHPAYVIIDVEPQDLGIPTKAYVTVEEVTADGKETRMAFQHRSSSIEALEAEEVGVEHLLRDVKDASVSTLSTAISAKVAALRNLENYIQEMDEYLRNVVEGVLPINHKIIDQIQDIFNLLPNLNEENLIRSFSVNSNDNMLVIYLSSIIRSVIALHNLIDNKLANKEAEIKLAEAQEKEDAKKEENENISKVIEEAKKQIDGKEKDATKEK